MLPAGSRYKQCQHIHVSGLPRVFLLLRLIIIISNSQKYDMAGRRGSKFLISRGGRLRHGRRAILFSVH